MRLTQLTAGLMLQAALDAARPTFSLLSISDIIPLGARDGYAEAGGDLLF